jgi:hypothetical protein
MGSGTPESRLELCQSERIIGAARPLLGSAMQLEIKDEDDMRASLARLGLGVDRIERAVQVWRDRVHPSVRKPPHPMKGKKRVARKENPAPGGARGLEEPGIGTGGSGGAGPDL